MLLFISPETHWDLKAAHVEAAEGNAFFHKRRNSPVNHSNSAGFRERRAFYGWTLEELHSQLQSHGFYVWVSLSWTSHAVWRIRPFMYILDVLFILLLVMIGYEYNITCKEWSPEKRLVQQALASVVFSLDKRKQSHAITNKGACVYILLPVWI